MKEKTKEMHVYELYPAVRGFSVKTSDYEGQIICVVARSIKEAYYHAYNDEWAEDENNPFGIIWTYNKWENENPTTKYFNGSTGYGLGVVQHGARKKEILSWMEKMKSKKLVKDI